MKPIRILSTIILMATLLGAAHAQTKPGDIVAVASGADNLKTLVAAVKAADLVTTLQGTGPFTVFAPTDAAFAKLPAGTLEDLLKPENKAKIVTRHSFHRRSGG